MATTVARLEAVLSAHTADFDRAMTTSQTKMQKIGKVATTAGLAVAGGLAFGLERSVKAALRAEVSQNRLEQSFKNAGLAITPYVKGIEAAEKAGRKLGFADEDTKTALGSLITATGSYTKAVDELSVAQDVARFKHVELTDATKMLTMAQTGSQRAAKQLGITVPAISAAYDALGKNASAAEKAQAKVTDKMATGDAVIRAVRDHVSGQADAYSKTASGGMEQFRAQLDHLEVSMGQGLLPILAQVAAAMARGTEYFSKHTTQTKLLVAAIGALSAALLAAKIRQIALNLAVLANPYVAATVAIIAMSAALVVFWNRSKEARTIIEIVTGVITMGLAPAIIETVRHWHDLTGAMSAFPAKAISAALDVVHSAVRGLNAGIHALVRALERVVDLFKWIIGKAGAVAGAVGGIAGAVGGAAGSVAGKLNPFGEGGPGAPAGALGPTGGGNMGSIVGAANAIDSKHFPYLWGGGHSGSTMNGPYDCSGAVSALLRAGGLLSGSMVSGQFMSYGKPGMGKKISILANPEHVYTLINGKAWGTSGQNPGGGAGWFSGGVRPGFAIRHPEGFDSGGWLKPGLTLAMNNTGRPERVLGPGEGGNVVFNFPNYVGSKQELMAVMREAAAQFGRRNNRPAFG